MSPHLAFNLTRLQHDLLASIERSDGMVIGTLGKDPLRPNRRLFETSAGIPVHQQTAVGLIKRGLLKCIHNDGPAQYFIITELGRALVANRDRKQAGTV